MYASSGLKSGEKSSGEDAISQKRNEGAGRRNDGSGSDIQDAVQVRVGGGSHYSDKSATLAYGGATGKWEIALTY